MLPLFPADLRQTILTDEVLMKIYQHAIKEHPKNFPVNISLGDLANVSNWRGTNWLGETLMRVKIALATDMIASHV